MRNGISFSVMTLATAVATPAVGQTAVPMVTASSSAQSNALIPDFSGIWGHPYLPGFEPPLLGPGPVVNKSRIGQVFAADCPLPPGTNILVTNINKMVGDWDL